MTKVRVGMVGDSLEIEDGGVIQVKSGARIYLESGAKVVEASGGAVLGRETLSCYAADIGTAGSSFVVCPFDGEVVGIAAVNHAANAGTKTVLTGKIAGSAITHPALEVAATAAAGTPVSVVPTAANAVAAGQALEVAFDGGSSAVTPATFTFTVLRRS